MTIPSGVTTVSNSSVQIDLRCIKHPSRPTMPFVGINATLVIGYIKEALALFNNAIISRNILPTSTGYEPGVIPEHHRLSTLIVAQMWGEHKSGI
jgi:hypothetical protein